MKKKGFLVLLFALVCLVSVGCGKDKKEDKKADSNVKTLKCTQEEEGQKLEMTIAQDQKSYKLDKANMVMTMPKSMYKEVASSEETLKELICTDENEEYKDCTVKFVGEDITVTIEYDAEKFGQSLIDQGDIKELDADTLKTLKESAEKDKGTCTIS